VISDYLALSSWPFLFAADTGASNGLFQLLILFGPLFVIWYLLIILPQQRQRKKTQEMLSNLKTGDRVLTTGGMYGTIVGFRDSVVQLQVAKEVKVEVARTAITGLQSAQSDGGAAQGKEAARAAGKGKD